ncbi:hypothetical protein [Marinobacter persicus]|uniref:Uncharacterized protein n=1 Tax=Marinobacter persicus TaxID=930118 RepID=A0A2S6G2M5_9GAMM|nr:hypothetical protein [Marinobacter persicus]PPK50051.1 hypothetical protein BY455_13621 [Marinobacter persicus]PPK52237.1 hypothetical protein B0H24_103621 [Marinobacter persicus]PPK56628.1 hypothetical protein BY454_13621 [Marinobacter persicus]
MSEQSSAAALSRALFYTDPMNTCCQENDCFDEYDAIAADIAERLENGVFINTALFEAIQDWFYDGQEGTVSERKVQPVIEWLNKEGSDGS